MTPPVFDGNPLFQSGHDPVESVFPWHHAIDLERRPEIFLEPDSFKNRDSLLYGFERRFFPKPETEERLRKDD